MCLQYSAILKNHIAKVVNSGKDAVTPSELADALVSHNGIANVNVQLGTVADSKDSSKPPPKKDKIGIVYLHKEAIETSCSTAC